MRKLLTGILFLVLAAGISAQEIKDFNEFSARCQSFYKNSSYKELHSLMSFLYTNKDSVKIENVKYPFTGFFTGAFSVYDKDSVDMGKVIETEFPNYNLYKLCHQLSTQIDSFKTNGKIIPSTNDMYWGAFMGSGDNDYLRIIVDRLKFTNEKDSLEIVSTGATALWSLCSNANNDPEIKSRLLKLAETYPEETKNEIIRITQLTPISAMKQMQRIILKVQGEKQKKLEIQEEAKQEEKK